MPYPPDLRGPIFCSPLRDGVKTSCKHPAESMWTPHPHLPPQGCSFRHRLLQHLPCVDGSANIFPHGHKRSTTAFDLSLQERLSQRFEPVTFPSCPVPLAASDRPNMDRIPAPSVFPGFRARSQSCGFRAEFHSHSWPHRFLPNIINICLSLGQKDTTSKDGDTPKV